MVTDLQRAGMWKRMAAWLFDSILLMVLAVGMGFMLSALLGYDGWNKKLDAAYNQYETRYGVVFDISREEYEAKNAADKQIYDEAYAALTADQEAMHAYGMVINLTLLITSLGILLGFVLMELAIPLKLGNGQTLGKKIFGIGLMQQDGVKVNGRVMFVRTILGKYTIETMVPVLILLMIWFGILGLVGTLVLAGILLVQAGMLLFTRKRLLIHDALACTVAVDVASQLIFPDRETMIAYKEKIHAEKAAAAPY